MIYDCFTYLNEADLLELRLNELGGVVDGFVGVEANQTFSGRERAFTLKQTLSQERFTPWRDRMTVIEVGDLPDGLSPRGVEEYQRNAILRGLEQANSADWIICSDLDEIPNAQLIAQWNPAYGPRRFAQRVSYYWFNCVTNENWAGSRIATFDQLLSRGGPQRFRHSGKGGGAAGAPATDDLPAIPNAGWHLSYMGGINQIQTKLASYAHTELNIPEFNSPEHIQSAINSGRDLFNRPIQSKFIPLDDSFPKTVLNNPIRWRDYIYPVTPPPTPLAVSCAPTV